MASTNRLGKKSAPYQCRGADWKEAVAEYSKCYRSAGPELHPPSGTPGPEAFCHFFGESGSVSSSIQIHLITDLAPSGETSPYSLNS
ncbi:hypothetical protein CB1_001514005 [Camelus ferus]|nr:hypothetical protein CB1_001514005 [Camelus ferus]